jgi:hypothetical protein
MFHIQVYVHNFDQTSHRTYFISKNTSRVLWDYAERIDKYIRPIIANPKWLHFKLKSKFNFVKFPSTSCLLTI